jgi:hypothetical protein
MGIHTNLFPFKVLGTPQFGLFWRATTRTWFFCSAITRGGSVPILRADIIKNIQEAWHRGISSDHNEFKRNKLANLWRENYCFEAVQIKRLCVLGGELWWVGGGNNKIWEGRRRVGLYQNRLPRETRSVVALDLELLMTDLNRVESHVVHDACIERYEMENDGVRIKSRR